MARNEFYTHRKTVGVAFLHQKRYDIRKENCCLTPQAAKPPKAPSDEGAVTEGDWGREKLPLSHAVRMTTPLTRGALGAVSASGCKQQFILPRGREHGKTGNFEAMGIGE